MILTEKEAEAKRCCRDMRDTCIGSQCMAWRWVNSLTVDRPSRQPGPAGQTVRLDKGYCGLAGRP